VRHSRRGMTAGEALAPRSAREALAPRSAREALALRTAAVVVAMLVVVVFFFCFFVIVVHVQVLVQDLDHSGLREIKSMVICAKRRSKSLREHGHWCRERVHRDEEIFVFFELPF